MDFGWPAHTSSQPVELPADKQTCARRLGFHPIQVDGSGGAAVAVSVVVVAPISGMVPHDSFPIEPKSALYTNGVADNADLKALFAVGNDTDNMEARAQRASPSTLTIGNSSNRQLTRNLGGNIGGGGCRSKLIFSNDESWAVF